MESLDSNNYITLLPPADHLFNADAYAPNSNAFSLSDARASHQQQIEDDCTKAIFPFSPGTLNQDGDSHQSAPWLNNESFDLFVNSTINECLFGSAATLLPDAATFMSPSQYLSPNNGPNCQPSCSNENMNYTILGPSISTMGPPQSLLPQVFSGGEFGSPAQFFGAGPSQFMGQPPNTSFTTGSTGSNSKTTVVITAAENTSVAKQTIEAIPIADCVPCEDTVPVFIKDKRLFVDMAQILATDSSECVRKWMSSCENNTSDQSMPTGLKLNKLALTIRLPGAEVTLLIPVRSLKFTTKSGTTHGQSVSVKDTDSVKLEPPVVDGDIDPPVATTSSDVTDASIVVGDANVVEVTEADGTKTVRYACQLCEKSYKKKRSLVGHMESHINGSKSAARRFSCRLCSSTFNLQCNLFNHMKTHSDTKVWECTKCNSKYKLKQNYEQHMLKIHGLTLPAFECSECQPLRYLSSQSDLNQHKRLRHHMFTCNVCSMTLNGQIKYDRHVRGHSKMAVTCSICNKSFRRQWELSRHMKNKHLLNGSRMHICTECGAEFKEKHHLKSHAIIHSRNSRYHTCNICHKSIKHLWNFKRHVRLHASELKKEGKRDFICEQCGRTFVRADNLAQHSAVHKPPVLSCEICGMTFKRTYNLKVHECKHLDLKKTFPCTKCKAVYNHSSSLRRHLLEHEALVHLFPN